MEAAYFSSKSFRLLGCHHASRSHSGAVRSVLLCPPIGHEYLRSHWTLRLLAGQLARRGFDVLRFDYRGIGDSDGSPQDVSSMCEWVEDVGAAIDRLKQISDCDSVSLLGLRTGAAFAMLAAREREDVHSLIAWEPVFDGANYLKHLRASHRTMIDLWASPVETVNDESFEELLGTRYRRSLIRELERFKAEPGALEIPQVLVELTSDPSQSGKGPPWQKRIGVEGENSWRKLCDLEVAWLRPKTIHRIAECMDELFVRLEDRAMLTRAMV